MALKPCGHVHNGNSELTRMTDEMDLNTEVASNPDDNAELPSEKMLPVSRVEELVKKAKLKGRDSMQSEMEALKAENATLKNNGGSMGGMALPEVDTNAIAQKVMNDLRQQMQNESEKRAQDDMEKQAKRIADSYNGKMQSGKDNFEDFDAVMSDFNPAAFPNLVYLADKVDNTPAVMYELMKNPSKWATLAVLSERDPQAAENMIARISSSIKANEQAKSSEKDIAPPLSRLSPSITGQDSGERGVRDYKKMFRG